MARKFMNQKGQASSTFQLLIAAVVAMAILVILVPIIMKVMGIITANPEDETKRLLGNAVDNPDSLMQTPEVAFKGGSSGEVKSGLSAKSISEDTGISADQICMGIGDFGSDSDFKLITGTGESSYHRITYNGTSTATAVIKVLCENDLDDLAAAISDYTLTEKIDIDDCDICEGKGTCCAVILLRR